MAESLGLVGLGRMGQGLARNLLKKGRRLMVYHPAEAKTRDLAAAGAAAAGSLAELAAGCEVVLFSLPGASEVEEVLFGAGGLTSAAREGLLVIDLSTTDYLTTLQIQSRLAALKIDFVDAPVSGWPAKALEGTLSIMAGGAEPALKRALPVLELLGNNVVPMGGPGNGQLTKMASQAIYNLNIAAMAEVYPMAQKMGLDPEKLVAVTTKGACRSFALESFSGQVLEGRFNVNYPLQSAYKDLESLGRLIAAQGLPMPLTQAFMTVYQTALRQGLGEEDKGALIKVYERLLGVEFRKK